MRFAHFPGVSITGWSMTKLDARRKEEAKESDPEQFQRFIEAARKRDVNESLDDFAPRFGNSPPPKPRRKLA